MTWKNNGKLLSQPLRLFWNGWESNTYELQRNGWEISAQEDISRRSMGIAIRHLESRIRGLSDTIDWDYWKYMEQSQFQDPRSLPTLNCQIASDIIVNHQQIHHKTVDEFNPIDARPMYMDTTKTPLDDLAHFRKIEKPSNEIFLREASLDEIMKMALSKQEPKQEQIRKEMVRQKEIDVMRNSQLRANLRLVA